MREIKFRAMTIAGEWVYGNLAILHRDTLSGTKKGTYISNSAGIPFAYEIRPETVGQFSGQKDKTSKEIYEGDIYRQTRDNKIIAGEVVFEAHWFCLRENMYEWNRDIKFTGEILGNIHENPELLKTKQEASNGN